ncbi:MAG TPA: ribosome maturation factor RimP [Candidatus Cloacimonadota bacterium]|nr:ribosome maturation factor RimP [Candidatus Cloacimonadota bacterium]HOV16926.1 ribosome maturation factor RimP [Candidatus Cloacimonadota bacterium]HQL15335.1 ribosome maturation factor RimP [Candidatus Cloacimonadota bacterium]
MEKYRSKVEDLSRKIASEMRLAVYDIEEKTTAKGKVIAVYLTKIGGVSLDECAQFSRALSAELDDLDFIPERYFLEVSSPGLERALKLKSHYASAINELVEIIWEQDHTLKTTKGWLREVNPDNIVLKDREEPVTIPFSSIHKARTCFSNNRTRE